MTNSTNQPVYNEPQPYAPLATKGNGKATATLVLGIVGGVLGIIVAAFVIFVGSNLDSLEKGYGSGTSYGTQVIVYGGLAIVAAIAGLVGGFFAKKQPTLAAILMIASGLAGFFLLGWLWVLCAILFIVGGVLALNKKK